jgi:alcohol dehydrogenase (cytochrome c)
MADSSQNYGATSAPLAVKDLVVSGTSGGDEGVRGFIAAYEAATGKRVWRFWTVPLPGEPLAKTWVGRALEHGCTSAWLTGTYDAKLDLLYWTTGNPCPDYNGDERGGDNLYSDSVLALKPDTGELKWHFQFTPHDLHDWDAAQTPMLIDARFGGTERHLLAEASRNGFFYLLDRTNGHFLLARPFVEKLTWASGIDSSGRPQLLPGAEPSPEGTRACPSVEGATNWFSTAYHPGTGLFYLMALEKCNIYTKSDAVWHAGESYYGGETRRVPGEVPRKFLRALDIQTGKIVWEHGQEGPATTWGGVLSTAGDLVFYGDDGGDFAAVNARTGRPLWRWPANANWKASPMTYMAGGRQFVAIAGGPNILAFGLP